MQKLHILRYIRDESLPTGSKVLALPNHEQQPQISPFSALHLPKAALFGLKKAAEQSFLLAWPHTSLYTTGLYMFLRLPPFQL